MWISRSPNFKISDATRERETEKSSTEGNRACNNGDKNSPQKIYAYMACMYVNNECPSGNFGDSSQLTNWILDSGATCHMKSEVSDFIPGLLEDTDKHIEVADVHHVTEKQKRQVQIEMYDNNRDPLIATLHNVLLAPDLCDRLFSIITLMNLGHACSF